MFKGFIYRLTMKILHKFNLHYAKPIHVEGGDIMRWCRWCGFRDVTRKSVNPPKEN